MITVLPTTYDVERLLSECLAIIEIYGWGALGQVNLTHRLDAIDEVFDGIGTLPDHLKEGDFHMLNSKIHGSYIEEVFNTIPAKIGRFRLMNLKARSCYSLHKDATMRIHLPLLTDPQALMIFPGKMVRHLAANGKMYLTDTTQRHTAMNGSLHDRYHLVGALV